MARHSPEIRLRPVTEADLDMFRRFAVEPGLVGLDWSGFRDPKAVQRRFDTDSYLGEDDGRLIVEVAAGTEPGGEPAGLVSYRRRLYGAQGYCWEIGIALLPEWRGQGSAGARRRCSAHTCSSTRLCSESRRPRMPRTPRSSGHWKRPGSPSKASYARPSSVRASGATAASTVACVPTLTPSRARRVKP